VRRTADRHAGRQLIEIDRAGWNWFDYRLTDYWRIFHGLDGSTLTAQQVIDTPLPLVEQAVPGA
jgi:hypothetical protein